MKRKIVPILLASTMILSSVSGGMTVQAYENTNESYRVEKVSHPDRGEGEIDGLLPFDVMGEESNRNQSYIWSAQEYGDYIYMGTCWNPISGIYYRNLQTNLSKLFKDRGMTPDKAEKKASEMAKSMLDVIYHGNFSDGETATKGTPVIVRVHKETYETEVVYVEKESNQFINWNGYRMAQVYKDKLYFICAGYPTSRLIQIDPETLETKVVMQKTAENPGFACGIRGLSVVDDQLIVSLATDGSDPDNMFASGSSLPKPYQDAIKAVAKKDVRYNDPNPTMEGVRILSTTNPEDVDSWKVIANQETFDNLPACYVADSINGGGVWDIVPFNDALYVTMVTGKTDPQTGVNNKKGFAMYRGIQEGESWSWTPIIGDTSKGAKYEFGLGKEQSCAGNLFAYNGHLYIGGYNDPMLDLAEIGNEGNFELLYDDFKNPACLYRMDENENILTINDDGFGAESTQYLWRFSEYNDKLFIGTFDISTLASGFTQLTDGSLLEMTPEEFFEELNYLKELLKDVITIGRDTDSVVLNAKEDAKEVTNDTVETIEATGTNVTEAPETEETNPETKETETEKSEVTESEVTESESTEEVKEELKEVEEITLEESEVEEIADFITLLDNMEAKANAIENDVDTYSLGEDIVDLYESVEKMYVNNLKPILDKVAPKVSDKIATSITNKAFHHFVYYLGCSDIVKRQEKGCDILYSEDGINFEVLTRNGFDDEYNHGGRAFIPTNEGLFVGMANPFWGTQLWKITDLNAPAPEEPDSEKPDGDQEGSVDKPDEGTETDKPDEGEQKPDEDPVVTPADPDKDTSKDDKPVVDNADKDNTVVKKANKTIIPKTGDTSTVFVWGVAVMASLATVVVMLKRKRFK